MAPRLVFGIALACIATTVSVKAQTSKNLPEKSIEKIRGTWKVQKVMSGKTEVARNPTSGQWIEFRSDGRYVNKTTSLDSGSFRLNENHSSLYLESEVHASTNKDETKRTEEWAVTLKDDTMTLQQEDVENKPHADKMKYVYIKIADGSSARKN